MSGYTISDHLGISVDLWDNKTIIFIIKTTFFFFFLWLRIYFLSINCSLYCQVILWSLNISDLISDFAQRRKERKKSSNDHFYTHQSKPKHCPTQAKRSPPPSFIKGKTVKKTFYNPYTLKPLQTLHHLEIRIFSFHPILQKNMKHHLHICSQGTRSSCFFGFFLSQLYIQYSCSEDWIK